MSDLFASAGGGRRREGDGQVQSGACHGWAPYGLRFGPGGRLVADTREGAALVRIGELAGAGLSLRAISRTLADEGIVARNGLPFAPKVLNGLTHGAAR